MAKRRTRKDKENAKHNIKITRQPQEHSGSGSKSVKGQKKQKSKKGSKTKNSPKNSKHTAKDENLASVKKDIVKSLSLAGLILGMEVVIYLFL